MFGRSSEIFGRFRVAFDNLRKVNNLISLAETNCPIFSQIGPLHDPVTWYGINYTGTQVTQWDFQNKGTRTSQARLSFVLKVPLRNLRPSVIYSVPSDRIVQRAYWTVSAFLLKVVIENCPD